MDRIKKRSLTRVWSVLNKGVKHCCLSFSTRVYTSWLCARHCAIPCGKSEAQRVAKFAQGHTAHKNQGRAGPMSVWGQSLNVTSRAINCSSGICEHLLCAQASQVALVVKNSPANAGDTRDAGSIPGSGRSPPSRKWQPTPVFLPGKIPWTEEPGRLQSIGSQRIRHDWVIFLSFFYDRRE